MSDTSIPNYYCYYYYFEKNIRTKLSLNISQAFPAGSGPMDRTTYMFAYIDPQPGCPKVEDLLEDYWDLMPGYQVNFLITVYKQS